MPTTIEDPRITVVIASRNRRADLEATLTRHHAPVVYLDNASTDDSVDVVRELRPDARVVRLRRNAGAYARTIGVRRARTEFVAFADDDSWWAPGALEAAAATLDRHPTLALLAARMIVGTEQHLDPMCAEMAASPLRRTGDMPGVPVLGFAACGAAVRREAFLEAGGFDPVVRFPGEEERLALDLAAAGRYLCYVDDVVVHHHPSPVRHSPEARVRAITRARVLTAAMRLPWSVFGSRVREAWHSGRPQRGGLADAARALPAALRARQVTTSDVLADLELLERPAPRPSTPAPVDPVARAPETACR